MPLPPQPAFLPPSWSSLSGLRRPRGAAPSRCPAVRMTSSMPTQARVLRLERALAAAIQQERYTDAATLRDALEAARTSDPVLAKRAQLNAAVQSEDFLMAARLRDELAALTERLSRGDLSRRVDRIVVLRGRGDLDNALRVATVSRDGDLHLPLVPDDVNRKSDQPRVFLQPTWSPSGDFVAMTEISFNIDTSRIARGLAVAEASSRIIIMNAFDGTCVKSASLAKPPFFYFWSPDGRCVTLLSNDPTASATSVALSGMQVVASPGARGLDLDTVTGPLATGHPFLYDFCPRDSSRVVTHQGDSSHVTVVPISSFGSKEKQLSSCAGAFGSPQWHPIVGRDGREVVLFAEQDEDVIAKEKENSTITSEPTVITIQISGDAEDGTSTEIVSSSDNEDSTTKPPFDKFLSDGSSLLESVLRKGAESLGLTGPKTAENVLNSSNSNESSSEAPDSLESVAAKLEALQERFRKLLSEKSGGNEEKQPQLVEVEEKPTNRLVMCDVDRPELRRVLGTFSGVIAFKLSPDGQAMASLITDPDSGREHLSISSGDFCPDSVENGEDNNYGSQSLGKTLANGEVLLSTPNARAIAFFWSPDARKLLFLSAMRESKQGACQWATFDRDTNKVVRYEKFVPSGILLHSLNFFDQFAASMTPWSPDSDAFCYPGRPLTDEELKKDHEGVTETSPSLSVLFSQKETVLDGKRFMARVQKVPCTIQGNVEPEEANTIVENVEYACWSPC